MLQPALFLDRDGIVNCENGYICRAEDFVFEPAFFELARAARQSGMPIVVITNQGGIGKGLMNEADLAAIHGRMLAGLSEAGLPLPHVFYCPHHPETSVCLCRKPSTLWFERALARYGLDGKRSWMLGDRERDLVPARALGMRTAMVGETEAVSPYADLHFANMHAAAAHFVSNGFA